MHEYSRVCPTCGEGYNVPMCDLCHIATVAGQPSGVGEPREPLTQQRAKMIAASLFRDCIVGWGRKRDDVLDEIASTLLTVAALSTPSPTEGASSPADARTEWVEKAREVGEGLREALARADEWMSGVSTVEFTPERRGEFNRIREANRAALATPAPSEPVCEDCDTSAKCHGLGNCPPAAPAPKPAPPAEPLNVKEYLDLALRIQRVGAEHPYKLEQSGVNQGMWVCQCGEVLGDQPIDEIDAVAEQHISKFVAELVRRAAERKPPR